MDVILLAILCFCHLWSPVHLNKEIKGPDPNMTATVTMTKGEASSLSELSWNPGRPVLPYQSYLDVYPTRFDIPSGIASATWAFQVFSTIKNCGNITVHFLLQQGGLPLVNQSSQSFPDDYYIPSKDTPVFGFELGLHDGRGILLSMRPSPGPWYIIAYTNEDGDGRIHQKGLHKDSDRCTINYSSTLQLGPQLHKYELSLGQAYTVSVTKEGTIVGFSVPTSAYAIQIAVSDCDSYNCSLSLTSMPFNTQKDGPFQECHNVDITLCNFRVPSPNLGHEQIFVLKAISRNSFNVVIQMSHFACVIQGAPRPNRCTTTLPMSRINTVSPGVSSLRFIHAPFLSSRVFFGWSRLLVIPFHMKEPNDIGHTLSWYMQIAPFGDELHGLEENLEIHVCGRMVYNYLPDLQDETFDLCQNLTGPVHITAIGGTSRNQSTIHVPYPRAGIWHLVLQASCFLKESGTQVSCPLQTSVDLYLNVNRCIDNDCGGHGECLFRTVGSELVTYSACKCYADYRGYGCQDDSDALPTSLQLAGALLLTMSNFLFLPAIAIAAKRKFYLEAFAYTYTMAFSTFYHACDGDRIDKYRLCIIPFNVLQSADFFGSSCSVWLTLIAMAALRIRYLTPVLQLLGPFGLFIGVVYDKTSLWVIASPIATGLLVVIISWGIKMYKRKKVYPSIRRYFFFLLPGVALATTAAVIYSFLETVSNYKYVHSAWHVSIALSICFLLPPYNGQFGDHTKDNISMTTPLTQITTTEVTDHNGSIGLIGQTESQTDSKHEEEEDGGIDNDNCSGSVTCTDVTELHQH